MSEEGSADLTTLTVQLLSAYLANNPVLTADLPGLIASTRKALADTGTAAEAPAPIEYVPAVSVRKSLASKDHILSLIDGKPYKMLKRHLATNGLTPAEYKARYNLPSDYPLVAPTYADMRRAVATKLGLGRKPKVEAPAAEPVPAPAPAKAPAKARRKAAEAESAPAKPRRAAKADVVTAAPEAKPAKRPRKAKAAATAEA